MSFVSVEVRDEITVLALNRPKANAFSPELVSELAARRIPLTVCPLSNVKLGVFPTLARHNLKDLLHRGLCVTVNSDDPAYFGGYVLENYLAAQEALGLTHADLTQLARNSITASFLPQEAKREWLSRIERYAEANRERSPS